jgi:hypothetical protein
MRKRVIFCAAMIVSALLFSCGNKTGIGGADANSVRQDEDGTISLKLDKANCYSDMKDPSANTAEWNVVVSKSGRYNVWLSSATRDTTDLKYKNSVLVSVHNHRLEAVPACDRIIMNSADVKYPYFRADSFLGSMYLQDTGTYHIQVISEKIVPKDYNETEVSGDEISKLISVSFKPVTR